MRGSVTADFRIQIAVADQNLIHTKVGIVVVVPPGEGRPSAPVGVLESKLLNGVQGLRLLVLCNRSQSLKKGDISFSVQNVAAAKKD